ncbi:hypothetical protein PAXINDRAFT_15532 [Paxillus involutus ATCC 200175]|uniref:Uncharacterized protein n=1 Tax=Paxillus involutus ATCC 200175 TaxID=664439 RepID=A0A0C9TV52_PAXIN|nr:hypothetical protein PAXINDRAFT_15532 [Paxillus involutus ATCC 200175]
MPARLRIFGFLFNITLTLISTLPLHAHEQALVLFDFAARDFKYQQFPEDFVSVHI